MALNSSNSSNFEHLALKGLKSSRVHLHGLVETQNIDFAAGRKPP